MEPVEIAVRAFVNGEKRESTTQINIPSFLRILVFDCETTADQYQNLIFGSYKIYDNHILADSGIFYDPKFVTDKKIEVLKKSDKKVIPVREFVDEIFLVDTYDRQTLCVGFNLPFDLSRLAIDFGYGRKSNNSGFSFKLTNDKRYPRIIIRHIDSTKSFIRFGTSGLTNLQLAGNFLDLRTISFALSSEKHTLESACEFFGSPIKKKLVEEHGKITKQYVKYNQNDVDATYSLYQKLVKEYKKYNLTKPITKIFSPASIGKSLLDDIGILPFDQISKVSMQTLGFLMSSYIGARTEVRIRKEPTLVRYLDFLSMYPTVCILQNMWSFVTAKEIHEEEYTDWTREFVRKISLDDLNNPKTWKEMTVLVCIKPDSDILPVRAKYGNKHAYKMSCAITNKILSFIVFDF